VANKIYKKCKYCYPVMLATVQYISLAHSKLIAVSKTSYWRMSDQAQPH